VSSTASGDYSTATGVSSTASGVYSTATGVFSTASGTNAIALGFGSTAGTSTGGSGAIAIGANSSAMGVNSVAIGNGVTASANNAIVIGDTNSATTLGGTLAVTGATTVGGNLTVAGNILSNTNVVSIGQNAIQIISGATSSSTGLNDRITTDGNAPGGPDLHLGGTTVSGAGVVGTTPVNVQVDGVLNANKGIINTGNLTSTGNAVIGSAVGSSVTVGNQNSSGVGTSTVSFNNNRVQNVAAATAATDAVNLGQVNQLIANSGGSSPALQNQVNGIQNQVNSLQSQVNQNNLIAQRGIASASAIAGIPAIETGKNFSVGVGVGNYVSASAISVGAQARLTEFTVLKIAAGTTSFGGVVTSAGLGISF
jgi:autotransporter adhesin